MKINDGWRTFLSWKNEGTKAFLEAKNFECPAYVPVSFTPSLRCTNFFDMTVQDRLLCPALLLGPEHCYADVQNAARLTCQPAFQTLTFEVRNTAS